jgi:hypothetical protein
LARSVFSDIIFYQAVQVFIGIVELADHLFHPEVVEDDITKVGEDKKEPDSVTDTSKSLIALSSGRNLCGGPPSFFACSIS